MRRPFVSKGLAVRRDFANLEETPFDSGRLRLATKLPVQGDVPFQSTETKPTAAVFLTFRPGLDLLPLRRNEEGVGGICSVLANYPIPTLPLGEREEPLRRQSCPTEFCRNKANALRIPRLLIGARALCVAGLSKIDGMPAVGGQARDSDCDRRGPGP